MQVPVDVVLDQGASDQMGDQSTHDAHQGAPSRTVITVTRAATLTATQRVLEVQAIMARCRRTSAAAAATAIDTFRCLLKCDCVALDPCGLRTTDGR